MIFIRVFLGFFGIDDLKDLVKEYIRMGYIVVVREDFKEAENCYYFVFYVG